MHAHSEGRYWTVALIASLGLHSVVAAAAVFYFERYHHVPTETEISILSVPLDRAAPTEPSQTLAAIAPSEADVLQPGMQDAETLTPDRSVQTQAPRIETSAPLGRAQAPAALAPPREAEIAKPAEASQTARREKSGDIAAAVATADTARLTETGEIAAEIAAKEAAHPTEARALAPLTQAGEAASARQTTVVAAASAPMASAVTTARAEKTRAIPTQEAAVAGLENAMTLGPAKEQAALVPPREAEAARPVEAPETARPAEAAEIAVMATMAETVRPTETGEIAAAVTAEAVPRAEPRAMATPAQAGQMAEIRRTMVVAAASVLASTATAVTAAQARPHVPREMAVASEVRESATSSPVTRIAPVIQTSEGAIPIGGAVLAVEPDVSDVAAALQDHETAQRGQTALTASPKAVSDTVAAASDPVAIQRSPKMVASAIPADAADPAAMASAVPQLNSRQLATAQAADNRAALADRSASLPVAASDSRAAFAERAMSAPATPTAGRAAVAQQAAAVAVPTVASAIGRSQSALAARTRTSTATAARPSVPLRGKAVERSEPTGAAQAPRVAAVVAPARPGSFPSSGPGEPSDPARAVTDFMRQYDGGDCFLALPAAFASGEAAVQTFGESEAAQAAFRRALAGSLGTTAEIRSGTVAGSQCLALSFARKIDGYPNFSLVIDLDAADVTSGSALAGIVRNAGNRFLHLLVIDNDGLVQSVDAYLAAAAGNARRFSAPVVLTGGPVATKQLLMALASDRLIRLLQGPVRRPAADFFEALAAEISAQEANVDLAVEGFSVN